MSGAAFGSLLKKGDGSSPENFTTLYEVLDIKGPEITVATEDVTSHSSPGAWSEHIPIIKSAGKVTFSCNYEPTTATQNATTGLLADLTNRTKRNFQLMFPDAATTTWAFAAYVTKFAPALPVKGKRSVDVELSITGQPTLA